MDYDACRLVWFAASHWAVGADDTVTEEMIDDAFDEWWTDCQFS